MNNCYVCGKEYAESRQWCPHCEKKQQKFALTENELAARWGLSIETLRRWRDSGIGPVFQALGKVKVAYLLQDVEELEMRTRKTA